MTAERFRFGISELYRSSRELRRNSALVRLQSQPAQGLGCLLESAGQVVSREELRLAMWHEDTFIDFEQWWKRKCPGTGCPLFAASLLLFVASLLFEIILVAHRVQVPRYLPRRQHQPVLFRVSLPL